MRCSVFLAAFCLVAAQAPAQQGGGFQWKEGDRPAADDPSRASKDGFGAMMV